MTDYADPDTAAYLIKPLEGDVLHGSNAIDALDWGGWLPDPNGLDSGAGTVVGLDHTEYGRSYQAHPVAGLVVPAPMELAELDCVAMNAGLMEGFECVPLNESQYTDLVSNHDAEVLEWVRQAANDHDFKDDPL